MHVVGKTGFVREFSEDPGAAPRAILSCRVFLSSFDRRVVVLIDNMLGRLGRGCSTCGGRGVVGAYWDVTPMREAVSDEKHILRV